MYRIRSRLRIIRDDEPYPRRFIKRGRMMYMGEQIMETMDAVLQKWSQEFILDSDWPEEASPEEKLDQYIFPQLQGLFTELEKDREYYQYRFYLMQWAFRKVFQAYGDIAGKLGENNIHFLPESLLKELQRQES